MPFRPAHHRHCVRHARVILKRRVARYVAVLAAGMLEDLLHRGEGGDRFGPLLRRDVGPAGSERRDQEEISSHRLPFTFSG
jgi:hypothetical protein